jgi:hypothetical protein
MWTVVHPGTKAGKISKTPRIRRGTFGGKLRSTGSHNRSTGHTLQLVDIKC